MLTAFYIICVHFIADFILQDEKWAINKSKDNNALLHHVLTYSITWFYGAFILLSLNQIITEQSFELLNIQWLFTYSLLFSVITFIAHFITDYLTSRVVSKLFALKKTGSQIPNLGAFTMIGFDQVLHYAQLFLTFYLITKK